MKAASMTDLYAAAAAVSPIMRHMMHADLADAVAEHLSSGVFTAMAAHWWPVNAGVAVGYVVAELDCSTATARRAVSVALALRHLSRDDLDESWVAHEAKLVVAYVAGTRGVKALDL